MALFIKEKCAPSQKKSHLDNVRVSFSDIDGDGLVESNNSQILQIDHYYPFGMRMGGLSLASGVENRYRYNGKELNTELGLGWYDYGFKWYDPVIAKFVSVDPLAESFERNATYAYAENRLMGALVSIIAADMLGKQGIKVNVIAVNPPAMKDSDSTEHPSGNEGINDMLIIHTDGDPAPGAILGAKGSYKNGTIDHEYQQVRIKLKKKGIGAHMLKNVDMDSVENATMKILDKIKQED